MKWIVGGMLAMAAIVMGVISAIDYVQAGLHMANLQLADDASTPEQKAKFLREFVHDMDEAHLPTHAAWIWTSERNKIANQKTVLESLIKRCDDLSGLNKESMGYSQGMTQITGQEFNHALGDVREIYEKAFYMSYGWLTLNAWWILTAIAVSWLFVCVMIEATP